MKQNYLPAKGYDLLLFLFLFFIPYFTMQSQTTIISSTGNGGFESGTTFAANGWTTVGGTATQNVWFVGTGATAGYSGSRCAYISDTSGGAHAYDIANARASFMYRNITIPAGESSITLSFKWLNQGESSYDKIRVWVVPTTFTPTSGTAISASGTAPTGNIQISGNLSVQGSWTTANYTLPSSYAGTTTRLVFEWTNDSSVGTQPPGAVDDISLVSSSCYIPTVTASTTSTTSGSANWTPPSSGTTPSGYEYIISTSSSTPTGSGTSTAATTANFTGLTANTTYYVFVRSNCGGSGFSSWTSTSFFTGYCASNSSGSSYYVNNFSTSGGTANITNNGSGLSSGGYGNFTAQSVSQVASGSISFSTAITGGSSGFNIWVDWNNDLDFNDAGEKVYASGAYVSSATGTFTVPTGTSVGNHRMRIITDGFSSDPSVCGSTTSSETEDYNLSVLAPLACSGNPTSLSVFIVSQTSSTISWTAASPAPANGYQYYLSTSNLTPSAATAATGSTGAGVTNVTLTGLTSGTTYYCWVRSNCGGGLGQGVWSGPISFTSPTCAVGPGTGTTTLGCPTNVSGGLGLSGSPAPPITCAVSCANLEVTYSPIKETSSYTVSSIPYSPPYQFNCMRNPVSVNIDDKWSPIINLPFNFCFYGNTYNQCVIGSNGVLTFDTSKANTGSGYAFANNLPSTVGALFANTIYGVYHDIDPSVGGEVGWELITLNTGCRALVASWNNVPMYSDNSILYTGMMVLYENTNIIEVYIKEKKIDNNNVSPWNDGNAIVGIQNATGSLATVAPNRNGLDTNWTATNEAWRFTPNGAAAPTSVKWYEGVGTSGTVVGTTSTISVCPSATTTYTAEVTYTLCNGLTYKNTSQTTVTVSINKTWNGSLGTSWNVAANWTPSGVPTSTDVVTIPNITNKPVITGGLSAAACSLNIQAGGQLTIDTANSIVVTNAVNVAPTGNLIINNTGALVQINNTANTGNIQHLRSALIRRQDYVFWSSPVANFPVTSISSGTNAGYIFKWTPTATTAYSSNFGNWTNANENMDLGKGYIVRGPDAYSLTVPTIFTSTITGVPNNGTINAPILRSTYNGANYTYVNGSGSTVTVTKDDDNWNLIGNPYPSALNADKFLTANTNIAGYIKLWTHGLLPSGAVADPFYGDYAYNYTPTDYHTYNLGGSNAGPGTFNGNIASGQGFVILMNHSASTPGTVTFNNSMRRDASNLAYNNTNFFKNGSNKTFDTEIEKNRIWLDLINTSTNLNIRTLVGYIEGATNQSDRLFDANVDEKIKFNLYSVLDEEMLTIQGRTLPFDTNDRVALGINLYQSGSYKIAIGALDGLFTNTSQNIYLEDKLLNITHDLRDSAYTFTSNSGMYNDRFVLKYTNSQLGTNDFDLENQIKVYASNYINVKSPQEKIKNVMVFDVLGKKLIDLKNVSQNELTITDLRPTTDMLLVKVILENGVTVTKKVIY